MEEAERLCRRVAIMDEGRIVAEGTVQELAEQGTEGSTVIVTFERPPSDTLIDRLYEGGAQRADRDRFQWTGCSAGELVPDIFRLAADEHNAVGELAVHRSNLGEVFLHLTGKGLRD
jgi:ABC-2 type transport system ATP-binding protein